MKIKFGTKLDLKFGQVMMVECQKLLRLLLVACLLLVGFAEM